MIKQKQIKRLSLGAFMNKYGIVVIFVALCILMSIVSPAFRTMRNVTNVVRQVSIIGIVSMGVTFAIITGGIDLSSGSIIALVSVVVASLTQNAVNPDQPLSFVVPIVVGIAVAILLGFLLGSVNGSLVAYGKIPPFIATLGMMTVARGAAALFTGGRPVGDLKETFTYIGTGRIIGIPVPIWIYIIMAIISHILLSKTKFGRHVFAIGGNEQAARICGISVEKTLVKVYAYAGLLTAVSAVLLTARTSAGNPTYGVAYELDAITATVIGGTSLSGGVGSIPFCVVGALIIGVLYNSMDLLSVNAYWQQIVKGVIIVVAVMIDARKQTRK
jgi:inositol transport system permease protein